MKRVYAAPDVMLVGLIKNALEAKGIDCILKNANLFGGINMRRAQIAKPELWILDDGQLMLANKLLDNVLIKELSRAQPWECVTCGQELENQFADCWSCGTKNDFSISMDEEDNQDEVEG